MTLRTLDKLLSCPRGIAWTTARFFFNNIIPAVIASQIDGPLFPVYGNADAASDLPHPPYVEKCSQMGMGSCSGVKACADTTEKVDKNCNWPIGSVGHTTQRWDPIRKRSVNVFCPWSFFQVKGEDDDMAENVLPSLLEFIKAIIDLPIDHPSGLGNTDLSGLDSQTATLRISTAVVDKSPALANLFNANKETEHELLRMATSDCVLQSEFPHLARYAQNPNQKTQFKWATDEGKEFGTKWLQDVRNAKSDGDKNCKVVVGQAILTRYGEHAFLEWVSGYMAKPWAAWQYYAVPQVGSSADSQALESLWKKLKGCGLRVLQSGPGGSQPISIATLLLETMPKVMLLRTVCTLHSAQCTRMPIAHALQNAQCARMARGERCVVSAGELLVGQGTLRPPSLR